MGAGGWGGGRRCRGVSEMIYASGNFTLRGTYETAKALTAHRPRRIIVAEVRR